MNRRKFLAGAAAARRQWPPSAARRSGRARTGDGHAPQGRGQIGGGGRGAGSPANVPAAKLARVSIMTLNFGSMLKFPWTQNPNENQTLDVFDLPKMYQDVYGVSHIEFQHGHLVERRPDAARRRVLPRDAGQAGRGQGHVPAQVNIEIGTIPNLAGDARDEVDDARQAVGRRGADHRRARA